jgi:hypothetical protein
MILFSFKMKPFIHKSSNHKKKDIKTIDKVTNKKINELNEAYLRLNKKHLMDSITYESLYKDIDYNYCFMYEYREQSKEVVMNIINANDKYKKYLFVLYIKQLIQNLNTRQNNIYDNRIPDKYLHTQNNIDIINPILYDNATMSYKIFIGRIKKGYNYELDIYASIFVYSTDKEMTIRKRTTFEIIRLNNYEDNYEDDY